MSIFDYANIDSNSRIFRKPWWFLITRSKYKKISKQTVILRIINISIILYLIIIAFLTETIGIIPYNVLKYSKNIYLIIIVIFPIFTAVISSDKKNQIVTDENIKVVKNEDYFDNSDYILIRKNPFHLYKFEIYAKKPLPSFEKCWEEILIMSFTRSENIKYYGYACIILEYYLVELADRYDAYFTGKIDKKTVKPYSEMASQYLYDYIDNMDKLRLSDSDKASLAKIKNLIGNRYRNIPFAY